MDFHVVFITSCTHHILNININYASSSQAVQKINSNHQYTRKKTSCIFDSSCTHQIPNKNIKDKTSCIFVTNVMYLCTVTSCTHQIPNSNIRYKHHVSSSLAIHTRFQTLQYETKNHISSSLAVYIRFQTYCKYPKQNIAQKMKINKYDFGGVMYPWIFISVCTLYMYIRS
jgi:hypothetical protein